MRRVLIVTCHLFIIVIILGGCGEPPTTIETSGRTIKIGIIAPFTGSDFAKGKEGLSGAQTALKIKPILDSGDRIEIVTKDDQDDAVKSVRALQELVKTDKVSAIFTLSSSGPVLALAKAADIHRTPILAALATHPDIPAISRFVSQVCFDDNFQGKVAALFVRDELLVDKVAVFQDTDSYYSKSLATEFMKKFSTLEGEVTDLINLDETDKDFSEILIKIKEKDPKLLYMPVPAENVIAIIQALDRMGWKPRLMASDGLLATVFSQHKEQLGLLNGLLATDFFHHAGRGTSFADRIGEVHQGKGTSYTAMGVEGFSILIEAINRCDNPTDKICINRQIRLTTDFEGLMGKISIDLEGKAHRPVVVNSIKNNKLKYIVKVY